MIRRKFIKRTIFGTVGIGALTGLYTWQVEPFWLEFVKRKMPIANLPDHLVGKTLMQISDVHIGNRFDYSYIIDSFKNKDTPCAINPSLSISPIRNPPPAALPPRGCRVNVVIGPVALENIFLAT